MPKPKTMNCTLLNDVGLVSWDHINQFYQIDSSTPIRMAPKLTNRHITLPAFANLNVALAVQVLSRTVAAGISSMVRSGELPVEASATSQFVFSLMNCIIASTVMHYTAKEKCLEQSLLHQSILHF